MLYFLGRMCSTTPATIQQLKCFSILNLQMRSWGLPWHGHEWHRWCWQHNNQLSPRSETMVLNGMLNLNSDFQVAHSLFSLITKTKYYEILPLSIPWWDISDDKWHEALEFLMVMFRMFFKTFRQRKRRVTGDCPTLSDTLMLVFLVLAGITSMLLWLLDTRLGPAVSSIVSSRLLCLK